MEPKPPPDARQSDTTRHPTRRDLLKLAAAAGAAGTLLAAGCGTDDAATTPDAGASGGTGGAGGAGGAGGGAAPDAGPDAALTDDLPRPEYTGEPGPEGLYRHGVASGDPLPDAVILWTRLSELSGEAEVEVFWEISVRPDFLVRIAVGTVVASSARDFTVKVDATGLPAGTSLYYRFHALGRTSPVGRTRTAPPADAVVERLRLALTSCASIGHGYYHTFRELSTQPDLDAVVHVGDYIYEYENGRYGDARETEPRHECVTLTDYRTRYAQHRADAWCQAAHRQHPFICVWDDHESCNGAWRDGAENHDEAVSGPWADRKAAAMQAWHEWLPVREQADGRIFRGFAFGDLVDLSMLDTRLWGRDRQNGDAVDDPERTLLGRDQEAWLSARLIGATARWRLIGQQVMMGHLRFRASENLPLGVLNFDQWDGYGPARQRLFDVITDNGLKNVVVLSGDIHSSWANELTPDPNDPAVYDPATGAGTVAVEFVGTSITSPGLAALQPALLDRVRAANPHVRWVDISKRGWLALDITPARVQGTWMHFERIREENPPQVPYVGGVWAVRDGVPRLVEEAEPAAPRADAPPLAG